MKVYIALPLPLLLLLCIAPWGVFGQDRGKSEVMVGILPETSPEQTSRPASYVRAADGPVPNPIQFTTTSLSSLSAPEMGPGGGLQPTLPASTSKTLLAEQWPRSPDTWVSLMASAVNAPATNLCWQAPACTIFFTHINSCYDESGALTNPNEEDGQSEKYQNCLCVEMLDQYKKYVHSYLTLHAHSSSSLPSNSPLWYLTLLLVAS